MNVEAGCAPVLTEDQFATIHELHAELDASWDALLSGGTIKLALDLFLRLRPIATGCLAAPA